MSFTGSPASRRAFAVPPVEMSSTPKAVRTLANSTNPVLSVALSNARRMRLSVPEVTLLLLVALAASSSTRTKEQTTLRMRMSHVMERDNALCISRWISTQTQRVVDASGEESIYD